MGDSINLSEFANLQNNQIIKKDSVYNIEGLENKTISALEGHYQNDDWNLNFNDGLDAREINIILSELDTNKDGNITDEEIVTFCENVGIAGKENQLATLAKNLISMVTNKDGKDIETKTTPPVGDGFTNNESAAEESIPEKTTTAFETEKQKVLEEYEKAVNNTFLQIRLDSASEYSPLSISALNSLLNGDTDKNYKLSPDRTIVTSGKYAIFDTTTNRYIDPITLKYDNDNNPDGKLQKNIQNGTWIIRTSETKIETAGSASRTIETWSDLALEADSRFRQTYFTADDIAAKAKYDKTMANINRTERHQEYLNSIKNAGGNYVAEKVRAIEEYWEATNNKIFQLRLDSAAEYSSLSISNLNSLLNGDVASNYKLNEDKTEVISGNYGIFDTRVNQYIDPIELKDDTGNNPNSILQQNLENGTWVIKTPKKTMSLTKTGKTIMTWNDIDFSNDSRFRQTYFTADDEAAKAKYDKTMSEILKKEAELG